MNFLLPDPPLQGVVVKTGSILSAWLGAESFPSRFLTVRLVAASQSRAEDNQGRGRRGGEGAKALTVDLDHDEELDRA